MTTLFLVESAHKAETIKEFLGKNYVVMATVGHIMDLDPKTMSVDIENNFEPNYIINIDKKEIVSKLKREAKHATEVIFASDPDREGEMIAWSAANVLGIKNPKRVTYTEITKSAVLNAIKNPRELDMNLIDAQKSRRILDRIVGYELSPLLMKILSLFNLSAGRVQSVVTRLIVDKEKEIKKYMESDTPSMFKFTGTFLSGEDKMRAILYNVKTEEDEEEKIKEEEDEHEAKEEKGIVKIKSINKAQEMMEKFKTSKFTVSDISSKEMMRSPAPPYSTATMQQDSANKLGFSIKRTMNAAQKLYESGYITYLRTDSVNMSEEAIRDISNYVKEKYGQKYSREVRYKTKTKNTQEAHEAVRPTNVKVVENISGKNIGNDEMKLYTLIWKRAVASQMTPAKIIQTNVHIKISNIQKYEFISKTEMIKFAGFLKVYNIENIEKENNEEINTVSSYPDIGTKIRKEEITGKQSYSRPPTRYNDASLVNKLKPENLNIGRPATTQAITTKILDRGYVEKKDVEGIEKEVMTMTLKDKDIETQTDKIMYGKENNRYVPTELGIRTNDFLVEYFPKIMDYKFTSDMEDNLDSIAEGKTNWLNAMREFYENFHPSVEDVLSKIKDLVKKNSRVLGRHPTMGVDIVATLAKFGPVVKMRANKKYVYAPIKAPLTLETITLDEAIKLLEYPKILGTYHNLDVMIQKGKFGLYIKYNGENYSIGEKEEVTLEEAKEIIDKQNDKYLWSGTEGTITYRILDGKFGKYISVSSKKPKKKLNVKLPKDTVIEELTMDKVKDIVLNYKPKKRYIPRTRKAKE